jgi:hypothetical protein
VNRPQADLDGLSGGSSVAMVVLAIGSDPLFGFVLCVERNAESCKTLAKRQSESNTDKLLRYPVRKPQTVDWGDNGAKVSRDNVGRAGGAPRWTPEGTKAHLLILQKEGQSPSPTIAAGIKVRISVCFGGVSVSGSRAA